MTPDHAEVFGGVDTHKQVHVAAAVDAAGRLLGTAAFRVGQQGYGELAGWLQSQGVLRRQRNRHGLTLATAAQALGTHPSRVSALERGLHHNRDLAERYQQHLTQITI